MRHNRHKRRWLFAVAWLVFGLGLAGCSAQAQNGNNDERPSVLHQGRAVLVKDANGVTIGRVIGMYHVGWPYIISGQGYRTILSSERGNVSLPQNGPLHFETEDCSGVGYQSFGRYKGSVFVTVLNSGERVLRYSPHDAVLTEFFVLSILDEQGICGRTSGWLDQGFPFYLNDPSITGIANTDYPARLVIE